MASWCKVDSNLDNHPKVRKAGNLGRQVFEFALRRNAQPGHSTPGVLAADELEPWYIATQLMLSETDATAGLFHAVSAGLLEKDGEAYLIVGFTEQWGKQDHSTQRVREFRDRKRSMKQGVKQSETLGNDETVDQKRGDKNREGGRSTAKSVSKLHPDTRVVTDAFQGLWLTHYQDKPTWDSKTIGQVNTLLKKHPTPVVLERMNAMFSKPPSWLKPPFTFSTLVGNFDRFVEVQTNIRTIKEIR